MGPTVSIVFNCHDRLKQLKEVMPTIDGQGINAQYIFVMKYDAQDLLDWVRESYPGSKYVMIEPYTRSRARNTGVAHAECDAVIVQNCEAQHKNNVIERICDHLIKKGGDIWVMPRAVLHEQFGIRPHRMSTAHRHMIFGMYRKDFIRIGGFNEFYREWGNEDVEFRVRCDVLGFERIEDPEIKIRHIAHWSKPGDEERWKLECRFQEIYSERLRAGKAKPILPWRH